MKISELITELQNIIETDGDIRVVRYDVSCMSIKDNTSPKIRHIREKRKRESLTHLHNSWDKEKQIEKVCLI